MYKYILHMHTLTHAHTHTHILTHIDTDTDTDTDTHLESGAVHWCITCTGQACQILISTCIPVHFTYGLFFADVIRCNLYTILFAD